MVDYVADELVIFSQMIALQTKYFPPFRLIGVEKNQQTALANQEQFLNITAQISPV